MLLKHKCLRNKSFIYKQKDFIATFWQVNIAQESFIIQKRWCSQLALIRMLMSAFRQTRKPFDFLAPSRLSWARFFRQQSERRGWAVINIVRLSTGREVYFIDVLCPLMSGVYPVDRRLASEVKGAAECWNLSDCALSAPCMQGSTAWSETGGGGVLTNGNRLFKRRK